MTRARPRHFVVIAITEWRVFFCGNCVLYLGNANRHGRDLLKGYPRCLPGSSFVWFPDLRFYCLRVVGHFVDTSYFVIVGTKP